MTRRPVPSGSIHSSFLVPLKTKRSFYMMKKIFLLPKTMASKFILKENKGGIFYPHCNNTN